MPWAGKWNKIRIGLLLRINGSATFSGQFALGVCNGTTNKYGAGVATCTNFVGVAQIDTGAGDDFTFSTGTQQTIFLSSTFEGIRRTGGVDTSVAGSLTTAKMAAPGTEAGLLPYYVEISRPVFSGGTSVQYTYTVFAPNTTARSEYAVPRSEFLRLLQSGAPSTDNSTVLASSSVADFGATYSETNGIFDTVNFWWENASNPVELAAFGVRKLN